MTKLSLTLPETGTKDTIAEPRATTALKKIEEFINGAELDTAGGNFKAEGITEASLSSALKTKLGGSFVGLEFKGEAASFEAESGKFYQCSKALTATLPEATAGRTIAVFNSSTGEVVKVSAKAGKVIKGDFFSAEVAELTENQHLLVEANGTNWDILAGEPKRTAKYSAQVTFTAAEATAGVEPSATRPAFVILQSLGAGTSSLSVGGVTVGATTEGNSVGFLVSPGQKWSTGREVKASTLLL